MKLASQIKSKKKALEDVRRKADPMSEEPGLRRDIDRLNTQAHNLVSTGLSMHALMCCISKHYLQQSQRYIKQLRIAEKCPRKMRYVGGSLQLMMARCHHPCGHQLA